MVVYQLIKPILTSNPSPRAAVTLCLAIPVRFHGLINMSVRTCLDLAAYKETPIEAIDGLRHAVKFRRPANSRVSAHSIALAAVYEDVAAYEANFVGHV